MNFKIDTKDAFYVISLNTPEFTAKLSEELQAEITRLVESGEFEENSRPVDIDALLEEDPEYAEKVLKSLSDDNQRTLQ